MAFSNNKVSFTAEEPNASHEDHIWLFFFYSAHTERKCIPYRDRVQEVPCIIFIPCWIHNLNLYQAYKKVTFI